MEENVVDTTEEVNNAIALMNTYLNTSLVIARGLDSLDMTKEILVYDDPHPNLKHEQTEIFECLLGNNQ